MRAVADGQLSCARIAVSRSSGALFWSDDDACWIADVPNLTSCSARGPTPGPALAEVETAIIAGIAMQAEAGRPISRPRNQPAIYTAPDAV